MADGKQDRVLKVMWEIKHPFHRNLTELYVFDTKDIQAQRELGSNLNDHIDKIVGKNGMYQEGAAKIIGMKGEPEYVFVVSFFNRIGKTYKSFQDDFETGYCFPTHGVIRFVNQEHVIHRMLIDNEELKPTENYKSPFS